MPLPALPRDPLTDKFGITRAWRAFFEALSAQAARAGLTDDVVIVSAEAAYSTPDVQGVREASIRITFTPPADPTFMGVHAFLEAPDISDGAAAAQLGDGALDEARLGTTVPRRDMGRFDAASAEPDADGNITITLPGVRVTADEDWRAYLCSYSTANENPLTPANAAGATPSIVVAVKLPGFGKGMERAPLVRNLSVEVEKQYIQNAWYYRPIITWSDPTATTDADRWAIYGGVDFGLLGPDGKETRSGIVPPGYGKYVPWWIKQPKAEELWTVRAYSADKAGRTNSYDKWVTPTATYTVTPSVPPDVTGFSVSARYDFINGVRKLVLEPSFAPPEDDPSFSGIELRVRVPGDGTLGWLVDWQGSGVYRRAGTPFNAAALVGRSITLADHDGDHTFTITAVTDEDHLTISGSGISYVTQAKATGVPAPYDSFWQALGTAVHGQQQDEIYLEPPSGAVTWDLYAVRLGSDGLPAWPLYDPGTSPKITLTIPSPWGSLGMEYAPHVTAYDVDVYYETSIDGVEKFGLQGIFTPPSAASPYVSSRGGTGIAGRGSTFRSNGYGGLTVYATDQTGKVEKLDVGPEATSFRFPPRTIPSPLPTYTVELCSKDLAGNVNTIQAGTPRETGIAVTAQTSGKLKPTRLDTTELGSAIALVDQPGGGKKLDVPDGALADLKKFSDTLRPIEVRTSLPALPNATYPAGSVIALTSGGNTKLYRARNNAGAWSWTSAVDSGDIAPNSVTTNHIDTAGLSAAVIKTGILDAGLVTVKATNGTNSVTIDANGLQASDTSTQRNTTVWNGIVSVSTFNTTPGGSAVLSPYSLTMGTASKDTLLLAGASTGGYLQLKGGDYRGNAVAVAIGATSGAGKLVMYDTAGAIGFQVDLTTTYTAATGPSLPNKFLLVNVGGTTYKIPLHSNL